MMYSKIMVPYDGSEHAKNAFEYAKGLAQQTPGVTVHVVHVVASTMFGRDPLGTEGLSGVNSGMMDYEQYHKFVQDVLDSAHAKVEQDLGEGIAELGEGVVIKSISGVAPAEALARYAEENGIDLVVMGRRGLGAIRGMLGSVSFNLLRACECPVLTVK